MTYPVTLFQEVAWPDLQSPAPVSSTKTTQGLTFGTPDQLHTPASAIKSAKTPMRSLSRSMIRASLLSGPSLQPPS
jgi:hypothetical protein